MDPDPDPDHAPFVSDFQGGNKKKSEIFCLLLFKGTFTSFFKDIRYQGFSYYFCLMIKGSGSRSGSVHTHCFSGNFTASSRNLTATSLGNLTGFHEEISRPEGNLTATPQQSHRCFGQSHAHY
jgi:hypothetical protein